MFTSLTKKLITLTVLTTAFVPALYCFDLQRDYFYLSVLIQNANAPAFKRQLDQLAASSSTKTPAFREMLNTLERDVEHAMLNTQAMRGADISGNIADNGYSQFKWGIGELTLAAILLKLHPERTQENSKVYFGMLATSLGSGVIGLISLKNSVTNYFLAHRYGKHIQTTLESLEEIKKQIAVHLNT